MKIKPKNHAEVNIPWPDELLIDVRKLIVDARQKVAQTVNAELTLLYWHIGRRIRRDILKKKRAAYGDEILQALSAKLTVESGLALLSPTPESIGGHRAQDRVFPTGRQGADGIVPGVAEPLRKKAW
jgi:hypothetical protein